MKSPDIATYAGDGELGRYYRAHNPETDELLAGMTIVPAENGGQAIDILVARPASAGEAVRALLTGELFKEFSGIGNRESATHVSISEEVAGQNPGVRDAFEDFAFAVDGSLVIPMPGPILIRHGKTDEVLGGDSEAPDKDFTGVFSYRSDALEHVTVEEFFRSGRYAGKIVTVEQDEYLYSPSVKASDAEHRAVQVEDGTLGTPLRVRFLKTLIENDPSLAGLVAA